MNLRWRCKVGFRRFIIKFVKIILAMIFRREKKWSCGGGEELFNSGFGRSGNEGKRFDGKTLNPAIRREQSGLTASLAGSR